MPRKKKSEKLSRPGLASPEEILGEGVADIETLRALAEAEEKSSGPAEKSPPDDPPPIVRVNKVGKGRRPAEESKGEAIEDDLREIYEGEDGSMPDLTVMEKSRSRRTRNILIILVAFFALLAAAAWAGFFVFKPFGRFGGAGVALAITGPKELVAGREETFTVRYDNREKVPLGSLEIVLSVPETFQLASAEPAATEGNRWVLGNIPVAGGGTIILRGRVVGAVGESSGVQAFATYVPANFNSEFQSIGSYSVPITGSVVTVAGELPESALPGDEVTYAVRFENTGDAPLPDAAVQAVYPQHFLFKSAEPAPAEGNALWRLGEIPVGGSGTVAVKGSFAAEAGGDAVFGASVGRLPADKSFASYAVSSSTIRIVGGELRTTLIVNGSDKGQPVNFGDTLRISLVYENQGEEPVKNAEISLHLDASPESGGQTVIDWDTLEGENLGKRDGETIRWTKREIAVLGNLAPGVEGTIDLVVKLREAPVAVEDRNYRIGVWIESLIGSVGTRKVNRTVQTGIIVLPVNSDARLAAGARYYNDDEIPVGTGPLPPKAGQTTALRVFWSVENSLHELSNLVVATTLPEGVAWTDRLVADAGEIRYDPVSRRVTWTVNRMPTGISALGANFEVSVTPAESNIGKPVTLTETTTFDADDTVSQSHLTRSAPKLDSNLEGDPLGSGRGVVVR